MNIRNISEREYTYKKTKKKILNDSEFCELSFLILTLYQEPMNSKIINKKLKNYKSDSFEFNEFLVFTYKNQITENKIKKEFSYQKIKDKCSKLIKSQYEENVSYGDIHHFL